MQYIKVDDTTWVKVDIENRQVELLKKTELEDQKEKLATRLAEHPEVPSDKFLLDWAKQNYPQSVDGTQRTKLSLTIASINEDLDNMV